ncbi:MAG: HEAT repeat domain-containing protein [Kiritimatiellia bacterium]|nr:HEAT repeat domain-containing protein [Kiritimatiellia bacterium]
MKTMPRLWMLCLLTAIPCATGSENDVPRRREQVLAAAQQGVAGLPELIRALEDEHPMVRRAAVRSLAEIGEPAHPALRKAYADADALVRRTAVHALGISDLDWTETVLDDPDASVVELVVRNLVQIEPRTERARTLLEKAARHASPAIRKLAGEALQDFRFSDPGRRLLRERPDMADHLPRIHVTHAQPLPLDGWLFRKDPARDGHNAGWFGLETPDAGWSPAEIGKPWETGYVGIGWYRREFTLPDKPEHLAGELLFEGVDESAWVWINGIYVGGHDIGPPGWDEPFRLDVTPELRWGAQNQITVRVMNTAFAGGIWKPITLETLNLK